MCRNINGHKTNCDDQNCCDKGRKVFQNVENPIDSNLVKICEKIAPTLRKNKSLTPNMITTLGLLIGLLTIYFLYREEYLISFILFWITYFFDCLDGYYARRYDMVTDFGDYYDHFRDIFITITIVIIIYLKLHNRAEKNIFAIVLIVSTIFMLSHFGCQELNTSVDGSNDCLKIFSPLIKHKEYITYTKYVGCGTFILILSLFILYLYVKH